MRVACLFSGGKDSNYARFWAHHQGWEVTHLVNLVPSDRSSELYHAVAMEVVPYQAQALGIPLVQRCVAGGLKEEFDALVEILGELEVDGIVTGGLRSEFQRRRFDQAAALAGIRSFAPLWHKRPGKLLVEMVQEGWDVRLAAVSAEGLGPDWLLRPLDEGSLDRLMKLAYRYRFNPDGEGGEYESVVLYGAGYRYRLGLEAEKIWSGQSGFIKIHKIWCE